MKHSLYWYGLSPVCNLMCSSMFFDREICWLHTAHAYGFSPLCDRLCAVRWCKRLNVLSHLYGFSPVCVPICAFRVLESWLREIFITYQADLMFLLCMCSHVPLQITWFEELFTAKSTQMRFLSNMCSLLAFRKVAWLSHRFNWIEMDRKI